MAHRPPARAQRRAALPACIAALLGLAAESALAGATHVVTSCGDAGPGSLRAVIADPGTLSGDTVDYSQLTCSNSVISLTTGTIAIAQDDLTISGSKSVQIIAKYNNGERPFTHDGKGSLTFSGVAIGPSATTNVGYGVFGGCVFSAGTVALYDSVVSGCSAHATYGYAMGGAIVGLRGVRLKYSQVLDSSAVTQSGNAYGGGVLTFGELRARYSTIAGNEALGSGYYGSGGGVAVSGSAILEHVTISANRAGFLGGGIAADNATAFTMTSSTVSGNEATHGLVGGVALRSVASIAIANSTVAFNRAAYGEYGAGLWISTGNLGAAVNVSAKIQSTLVSNNGAATADLDISQTTYDDKTITFDKSSQGNLFRVPGAGTLPIGTITGACPNLAPLRDNGGLTRTHAIGSRSIALDNGANPNSESQDQRGLGADSSLYPRESNGRADIGAFELNQGDTIFNAGNEGCNPLP